MATNNKGSVVGMDAMTYGAVDPPPTPGAPEMFEWSVWDPQRREVATGLTDSEARARQRVTDVMRGSAVAVDGAIAVVDLDDGCYLLLRSVANAYRGEDNGIVWSDLDE